MSYDLWHRTTVSCMVATVTLNISDEVYQRLELNAQATQRSIEDILAYVFKVGSPPEWQDVPEEYRDALRGLDALSDDALRQLAMGQMAEPELERSWWRGGDGLKWVGIRRGRTDWEDGDRR